MEVINLTQLQNKSYYLGHKMAQEMMASLKFLFYETVYNFSPAPPPPKKIIKNK